MPDLTALIHSAVLYSTPLILAAIGGLYSERSGVVNIALEGLMIIGAFTAAVITLLTGSPWIGLAAAMVAGVLMAVPHAVASITFKADQVVSGVAINFLALGLSVYLVKYMYDGAGKTPTVPELFHQVPVPLLSDIPVIGPALFNQFPTTYLAFLVVIATYVVLYHTPFGMRLRSVGEHPQRRRDGGDQRDPDALHCRDDQRGFGGRPGEPDCPSPSAANSGRRRSRGRALFPWRRSSSESGTPWECWGRRSFSASPSP